MEECIVQELVDRTGSPSAEFFRSLPMVNAEGCDKFKGSVGKVLTRSAFRYLQIGTGPSAFANGTLRDTEKK